MMKKYDFIQDLVSDFDEIENHDLVSDFDKIENHDLILNFDKIENNDLVLDFDKIENNEAPIKFNKELIPLLDLLEKVNPCSQSYEVNHDCILVTYFLRLNLFNFLGGLSFKINAQIIGLPISISEKGYRGDEKNIEAHIILRKGLKILLNGNSGFKNPGKTLSTFVFENRFVSFKDYLDSLRSSYRRRLKKALSKRELIKINKFDRKDFNGNHYKLYLSIMNRTKNPLEILPIEFFANYEAELYEFISKDTNEIIGFIQLKEMKDRLCFLFGGFKQEDNEPYDLYYNMLLKIVETGIEKKVRVIEFGQTAEESKLKIGCVEVPRYLYVHHSNPVVNWVIQILLPLFSYKPYQIKHHVFK